MRPYNGARTGGVLGFGRGIFRFVLGSVTVSIALVLATLSGLLYRLLVRQPLPWCV